MQLILLENIPRLGRVGELVKVRPGFGRNFLIPQKKAIRATEANKKEFETRRAQLEKQDQDAKASAEKRAKQLEGTSVKIVRQASEDGKLYGSVSVRDIAKALEENGVEVKRSQIDLNASIKELGAYTATIVLHADVKVDFEVQVVRNLEASIFREEEEAAQADSADAEAGEQE